jgi:aryl-alcohol dehydrogenase-like predicted oxidoreductase
MFDRTKMEKDYSDLFAKNSLGTTIWSPLKSGILTGKYNDGVPEGSRFDKDKRLEAMIFNTLFGETKKEQTLKQLNALADIAKELGVSMPILCLTWCIVNKDVSTCLLGASKVSQLEENLKCLDLKAKWSKEIEDKIDAVIAANKPEQELNWRNMTPRPNRRTEAIEFGA